MDARRQLRVGVATLVGVYLAVFGPGVLTSLREIAGMAGPRAPTTWADRVAAFEWDAFSTAAVLIVVVRWLPRHAPLVAARMRLDRPPVRGGLLGAAATYVAVAVCSGWLGDRVVAAGHLARGEYTQLGSGTGGFVVTSGAAAAAGITEEITMVALAAAVVRLAFDARARRSRLSVPAMLAVLVALRWLVHAYYLGGSVFVLFWVPGAYVIYRWVGSVWPLVLGHWIYDELALAQHAYPGLARALGAVLFLVASLGVVTAGLTGLTQRYARWSGGGDGGSAARAGC